MLVPALRGNPVYALTILKDMCFPLCSSFRHPSCCIPGPNEATFRKKLFLQAKGTAVKEVKVAALVSDGTSSGARLLHKLRSVVPENQLTVCRTLKRLASILSRPGVHPEVVVLLASTRGDLDAVGAIHSLLSEARVVIVLPDMEEDTLARAHKLFPRFLSYMESDFQDVAAVVVKVLSLLKPPIPGGLGKGFASFPGEGPSLPRFQIRR